MKPHLRLPRLCLVLLAVLSLAPASWAGAPATVNSGMVKKLFKNPPRQFSTGPLWVWNDRLTEEQIRETLNDLAQQKVKQVWVHPRPGLMTPYLSADWFRLWKVALAEAERLDMNVWIYDENSYPSGFAGGLVPEAMPESRGRGLDLREVKTAPAWSDNLIAIYRLEGEGCENVSAKVRAGEAMPEGRYIVAAQVRARNTPWNGNRCYVNLLSPGVTEKFLEVTLEPYRREIGAQFGKRVPGVFTDEPNIRPAGGLPWSEILVKEFEQRWHYDLLAHLPSLTQPVGDWRKLRHNYYQVLNEQFIDHWARPYHDYCETNHLQFTGHYWDHEWPNCVGVPDNMAMYAWHQTPAIDCLMNQYAENTHAQFGNLRMAKELSSVANQLGMERTLCELYGAGGWDLRFEDMKRIGDWLEVLGVNTLNQHLTYITIRGARKRDHPQSFSYHEPWWKDYHVSAAYFARLSAALSKGQQINRVLVLEPTTAAWMYQGDRARLTALGDSFFNLLRALEAAQVEYDIGCEDLLARHGSVQPALHRPLEIRKPSATLAQTPQGAELRLGNRSYSQVIIPPLTENLNSPTVKLLEALLQPAGADSVLALGEPPTRVDGQLSDRVAKLAQCPGWSQIESDTVTGRVARTQGTDALSITREMGDKGILLHHRRQIADGQILFLVNTSIESPSRGVVESGLNGIEQWDLYTGKVNPYPFELASGGVRASFNLPPSGSLLLFLSEKANRPARVETVTTSVLQPTSTPEIRRLEPNVLTLDYVDVTAGGETKTNIYFYPAGQFVWQKNGMDRNPWDSAVQFKDELISKQFPPESGFEASYKFVIQDRVPSDLAIVIERPDLYTIACNGHPLVAKRNDWWLDRAFGRLPLAGAAQVGENVVTMKAHPFTMFHELEPAYVLGSFTLQPAEHGFTIVADHPLTLGNGATSSGWNTQGHPFYSAGVAYTECFDFKKKGRFVVSLPNWCGSVAEVRVNGRLAGIIDAPPWECDVTKQVRSGGNQIEVTVNGTLKNTLGPHHGNPKLGAAWPRGFQTAPPQPPPGTNYSTVAYGLFEPFTLKQTVPRKR